MAKVQSRPDDKSAKNHHNKSSNLAETEYLLLLFFFTKNCPQDQCQAYAVHKYPIPLSDKSLLRPILHEILFLTLKCI